jgi:glyoxalase/bleomycin resistance protein/dioxygenase superfamily protein
LIDWTAEDHGPFRPIPDDVYFATRDLDSAYERVMAAGAEVTSGIETRPWHERSFYCLDPHANPLCFVDDSTLFTGRGAEWSLGARSLSADNVPYA